MTDRAAALEQLIERATTLHAAWIDRVGRGTLTLRMIQLGDALTAVKQAAPEGSQNIPIVFPVGSIGTSTQAPEGEREPISGSRQSWVDLARTYLRERDAARAAIREAASLLMPSLPPHEGLQEQIATCPWCAALPDEHFSNCPIGAWLALAAVTEAGTEEGP
jgi:hypothetical protein